MDVSPAFTEIKYLLENTWGKADQGLRGGGNEAGPGGWWPEGGKVRWAEVVCRDSLCGKICRIPGCTGAPCDMQQMVLQVLLA